MPETSSVCGYSLSITALSATQKMPKAQLANPRAEPFGTQLKTAGLQAQSPGKTKSRCRRRPVHFTSRKTLFEKLINVLGDEKDRWG